MRRKVWSIIAYLLGFGLAFIAIKTCFPRHYNAPAAQTRAGVQYWQLSTGSRIAYTLLPAKGAKKPWPVVYLHGGPGGPIYNRNVVQLAPLTDDGYDVYLYDQIGGGQSARLDDIRQYTADRQVRDLAEIVRQTGAAKAVLIGQSWGGMLAALFAAQYPELVEKIVFTCPGPIPPMNSLLAERPAPDSLHLRSPLRSNAQANRERSNIRVWAVAHYAQWFGKKLASDEEMDAFATYLNAGLVQSTVCDPANLPPLTGGGGYYVQIMTIKSLENIEDPRTKLQNSLVPVLVMKGQCDSQAWGFTQEYLQLFQRAEFALIPDAGHAIAVEQPESYLQTIRRFLAK